MWAWPLVAEDTGPPASRDSPALTAVLATLKPGDAAKVDVIRADGSQTTVTVTLGQIPGGG